MKLVDVAAAKEYANTVLNDPFLKMAVNSVLDHAPGIELVRCKDCKYFLRHTQVDTDRGDCACYGIGSMRVKHIDDYCSKGRRENDND